MFKRSKEKAGVRDQGSGVRPRFPTLKRKFSVGGSRLSPRPRLATMEKGARRLPRALSRPRNVRRALNEAKVSGTIFRGFVPFSARDEGESVKGAGGLLRFARNLRY